MFDFLSDPLPTKDQYEAEELPAGERTVSCQHCGRPALWQFTDLITRGRRIRRCELHATPLLRFTVSLISGREYLRPQDAVPMLALLRLQGELPPETRNWPLTILTLALGVLLAFFAWWTGRK